MNDTRKEEFLKKLNEENYTIVTDGDTWFVIEDVYIMHVTVDEMEDIHSCSVKPSWLDHQAERTESLESFFKKNS